MAAVQPVQCPQCGERAVTPEDADRLGVTSALACRLDGDMFIHPKDTEIPPGEPSRSLNVNPWTWSGDRLVLAVSVLFFGQFVYPQLFGATAGQVRWAAATAAYLAAVFTAKIYGDHYAESE